MSDDQTDNPNPPEASSVTNVSGGVNANAEGDINIGGDAVGRDKIEQHIAITYSSEDLEAARRRIFETGKARRWDVEIWTQDARQRQMPIDLRGANLAGLDLSGINLSGADLSAANLHRANLSRSRLQRANLTKAHLHRANLKGADLRAAKIAGADISEADLIDANMEGAVWAEIAPAEAASQPEHQATPLKETPSPERCVLVIEDIFVQRQSIERVLEELGLCEVSADNFDLALESIRADTFDLVLLDMQLDELDPGGQQGILLLEQMQTYQKQVPVIIISALPWSGQEVRDFLREYGAYDYLPKPFKPQVLRQLIRQVLNL